MTLHSYIIFKLIAKLLLMVAPGSAGYSCNKVAVAGTDFHFKRFDLILFTLNKPAPVQV